jgi:hypothetical protein
MEVAVRELSTPDSGHARDRMPRDGVNVSDRALNLHFRHAAASHGECQTLALAQRAAA